MLILTLNDVCLDVTIKLMPIKEYAIQFVPTARSLVIRLVRAVWSALVALMGSLPTRLKENA